jgi:hypothetical protein
LKINRKNGDWHVQSDGLEIENAVEERHGMNRIGRLTPQDIRLVLCVMAFITPSLLQTLHIQGVLEIRLYAPIWSYVPGRYPSAFELVHWDVLIVSLPFGLAKLLFVQQVYLFMFHRTSFRRVVVYGVVTEMLNPVLAYVFSGAYTVTPFFGPVPVVLALGLLLAARTPKKQPDWLDEE